MAKKHEKKQWLIKTLAESSMALTVGVVFTLSPGQSQGSILPHPEQKQSIIDRVIHIKSKILEQQQAKDDANDTVKMPQLLAQWPNWCNGWCNR